jgi:GntR family transcriptional repressor for pyruvate dehydrogenase complex
MSTSSGRTSPDAADVVVNHVRALIEHGQLQPGDRLPPERDLAAELKVSRPSVRAGLRSLATMGVVRARHGAGTFITAGPPALDTQPLSFLAALHGFTRKQMFEARLALEVAVAGLAAESAAPEQMILIGDEATEMFARFDDPQAFLVHDIQFHRAVGLASGNPILASLVEMVSALFLEQRRRTISQAHDLREAAEEHRVIYLAIRAHDPERARRSMSDHLLRAWQRQEAEEHAAASEGQST